MTQHGSDSENPVIPAPTPKATRPKTNQDWWPNQLNLQVLRQHGTHHDPLTGRFDYAADFSTLDLAEVERDIVEVMTTSQPWWPADYGHYGPLFIRMAWHAAGTYRVADGRGGGGGGAQRFAPLNSWPDNANLDKARRLLWPVKQKYGRRLSWGDLIIFAGNCALESMGFTTFGFGGGRVDFWEPDDIFWGPEDTWLGDERYSGERDLAQPLGAVQMGLIYVNPEGPAGNPDPLAAAGDIRETFARMAMNDEETVALIVGGHTFGKCHGAVNAEYIGVEPEGCPVEMQGLGWRNIHGTGHGSDTTTSGLEGAWTTNPTRWDNGYLDNLYSFEWRLTSSPAGAKQWEPADADARDLVPDAHDASRRHAPMMLTTDLALRADPAYEAISRRFHEHPEALADAFARAWFKLTHRDMGPRDRYLGSLVPSEVLIWQDPILPGDHPLVSVADIADLKRQLLDAGLTIPELVRTAWAAAACFRGTDKRGGANGARLRLEPQRSWSVNEPGGLGAVLTRLDAVRQRFNESQPGGTRLSLADTIVLGGCAAVERAARDAGHEIVVPFLPGRGDARQEDTDIESFDVLEPRADGFRNWLGHDQKLPPETLLLDRANLLTLTPAEMTVLVGGLRVLGANAEGSAHGVFTDRVGVLTNDFFVNVLDSNVEWRVGDEANVYRGSDRRDGSPRWTATSVDLVFGANAELRALCEVYGADDGAPLFVQDFVRAWDKVMNLDRFDVPGHQGPG